MRLWHHPDQILHKDMSAVFQYFFKVRDQLTLRFGGLAFTKDDKNKQKMASKSIKKHKKIVTEIIKKKLPIQIQQVKSPAHKSYGTPSYIDHK